MSTRVDLEFMLDSRGKDFVDREQVLLPEENPAFCLCVMTLLPSRTTMGIQEVVPRLWVKGYIATMSTVASNNS